MAHARPEKAPATNLPASDSAMLPDSAVIVLASRKPRTLERKTGLRRIAWVRAISGMVATIVPRA